MLERRDLLRQLPPLALAVVLGRPMTPSQPQGEPGSVFRHGVASGDPTPDRVVLWTRVSGAGPGAAVAVRWVVASDPNLSEIVASGTSPADPEHDWTVHVDAGGLRPATTWWYRFEAEGQRSPVGRTRTAPAPDDDRELRLGVVSCASHAAGLFTVYRRLSERDVDLVVHLGDYIYESNEGDQRSHVPQEEPTTLADYRARHAQQRSDADLQALHQRFAFAAVWDDHEVAADSWEGGAAAHNPRTQGPWGPRRAAGLRAYLEWMPLRRPDPATPERIWRSLPLGSSAELVLIDTRHDGRDRQVGPTFPDPAAALDEPDRRIMSDEQQEWLADRLRSSPAAWRLVANQVVLSPLRIEVPPPVAQVGQGLGVVVAGAVMNPDQWDGYPAARQRLLEVVAEPEVGPVVFLTGDIHSSWAFDVPPSGDLAATPVATELVAPSVTSATFAQLVGPDSSVVATGMANVVADQLPHVRWTELQHHGYVVVAIRPEAVQADWWHVDAVDGSTDAEALAASWMVEVTEPRLRPADGALGPRRPEPPPPVPPSPPPVPGDTGIADLLVGGTLGAIVVAVGGLIVLRRRRRSG
ncbi:MAG TPA: alkaline phosphatase D family protein [Acidimicrobiales bacterium]|nr:alkaline phosphatase D family protein [Acidimicrobiales bacterium]